MSFLIQAASSVDGQLYTWASDTRDFAGANYPGDGTPTDVVIAARQAEGESGGASSNVLLSNATSGSQDDIESTVEGVDARAIRLSGDDPVITGIAGGAPGRPLDLIASTHGDVTLAHESTSSSATNRIVTPTAADMTVASGASVALVYDSVSERWRVVGAEGGGATPGGSTGSIQFNNAGALGGIAGSNGDILYRNAGAWNLLAIGAEGATLKVVGGLPAWVAATYDPAVLALTGWWRAGFGGSPWVGTASTGASGSRDLTEATNPPSAGASQNGFTTADFDGTDDKLSNGTLITSFVSDAAGSIAVLFNADTAAADAGASTFYNNPALVAETGGRLAVEFSTAGVGIGTYNGSSWNAVRAACGTGGWHLAQARWNNTTIEVRVDSGSWQTLARTLVLSADTLLIGRTPSTAAFFDGRVLEVLAAQSRLDDTTFNDIKSYVNARYALAL